MATRQPKDSQTFAGQAQPGVPLLSYPTPTPKDILISEIVDTHQPSYQAMDYGTPYSDTINFPNHVLVKQHPRSYEYIERIYAAQRIDEDAYNYGITYQGEDTTKPIFSRTYYVKRSTYQPLTTADPLTGVTRIDVTNGGSGYSSSASITITGTHTTIATAVPHIVNGVVTAIYVTNEGSGYTAKPAIAVVDSTGIGAIATSSIQGASIYLTKEILLERNDSDPIETIYGKVQRLYETLPGPAITSKRIDGKMNVVIQTTKTKVLAGSVSPGVTIIDNASVTFTEEEQIDSATSWEVVTFTPQSPYNSYDNSIAGQTWDAARYPARIIFTFDYSYTSDLMGGNFSSTNTTNQVIVTPDSEVSPANNRRWYLIQTDEPVITPLEWTLPPQVYTSSTSLSNSSSQIGLSTRQSVGSFLSEISTPTLADYLGYSYITASFILTQYSSTVVGIGSHFTVDFISGQKIATFNGGIPVVVNSITTSQPSPSINMNSGWTGPNIAALDVGGIGSIRLLAYFVNGSSTAALSMSDSSTVASHVGEVGFAWPVIGSYNLNIGTRYAVVSSVSDDTHLTLVEQWYGATNSVNYNSKVIGPNTPILGTEQIRRAKVEQLIPGLWEINTISYIMK